MLNYLWAVMILIGILWGAFTGNIEAVTNAALDSSKEAVTLCLTMCGIMALWVGLMEIAKQAGLIEKLTRCIRPFLKFMFPDVPQNHPAMGYIATNTIANFLGLGWAATPAGIKSMEELAKINSRGDTASNTMCSFLILNISSIQLIPVNVIAYRSQYGSASPVSIVVPAIIATTISTLAGIVFAKIMERVH